NYYAEAKITAASGAEVYVKKAFEILAVELDSVTLEENTFVYTGEQVGPSEIKVYAMVNGIKTLLTKDVDYTITENEASKEVTKAIRAGEYTVKVTGKGNFKGTVSETYTIVESDKPMVTGVTNGASYCEDKTITITDANLSSVKITKDDGSLVKEETNLTDHFTYTLAGTSEGTTYTVVATDESGNTNETMVVTVYEDHSFTDYKLAEDKHSKTADCDHNCGENNTITLVLPVGTLVVNQAEYQGITQDTEKVHYMKENLNVSVKTEEVGTGSNVENTQVKTIQYVLLESAVDIVSKDNAGEITWSTYKSAFNVVEDGVYVVYIKITYEVGKVEYISTEKYVIDHKAPKIAGVESGKTYCEQQTITVTDTNLDSITVNGTAITLGADGTYTLTPSATPYEIVATDKAGNTTTISNVKVNDGHTYKNPVITWSENFQKATATFDCEIDNTHEKLVLDCEVTRELTKEATGTESGKITYTAKVKYNGEEYDDQKDKETNITDLQDENGNSIATEVYVAPDVPKTTAKNMNVKTALAILDGEGKEDLADNSDILMFLEIQNADQTVPQNDKGLVEDLISTIQNTNVGTYLDISLYLKINQEKPEKLSDTYGNKITLTVDVPDKLKNTNPKLERTYSIVRVHSGKSELLNTVYDSEKNTLTFETDRFSTYAIAFTDKVIEEVKPPVVEPDNPPSTSGDKPENPANVSDDDDTDDDDTDDDDLDDDDDDSDMTISKSAQQKNELALNAGLKVSQTGSIINIAWGRVSDAEGYDVYVQYCGLKFTSKSLNSVNSGKITKIKVKKVNGKKLDLKKNYKIYVVAYKFVNGKKVTLGRTITAHIVGKKNTKSTNVKAVKVKKSSYRLKVGGTATIKARTVLVDKNKNQLSDKHAKEFRYASSNKKVATVSSKGKIKAVGKGTCIIYVYARNGYAKKVKVTVE
ncbi:MAG: Ig-like domain-containing protein, partial [Clostridiales bacterium]|nr:Ig-like domain-containing protein [Clostridiales bacterium]